MSKYFIGSFMIVLLLTSCKKQMDNYSPEPLSDYYPLQVGKYITYNLDSTLFINFGQKDTVIHYQIQDRVDSPITDNTGRDGFRILRFIRHDTSEAWAPNNTFMVTPTENSIEFVENNLRFIKLKSPLRKDYTWKGNSFIDTYSNISNVRYLDDWDYIYDSLGLPLSINSINIDSTIKVFERDEFIGEDPSLSTTQYAEENYSVEKYGKGIGLIYREFLHWEYQGPQSPTHGYSGYGIKMSIIDHN